MRPNFQNLVFLFIAIVATASPAWASEISDFKIEDEGKRIRLTFMFTETSAYKTVTDFNSNILVLNYEGVEFSNKQRSKDHRLEGDENFDVLRFVRFQESDELAEIRIYLGWKVTPADAQVVAFEDRIEVDILKPIHLLVEDETYDNEGSDWIIERGSTPDETGESNEGGLEIPQTNPTDVGSDSTESQGSEAGSGLELGSLRDPFFPDNESGDSNPATDGVSDVEPGHENDDSNGTTQDSITTNETGSSDNTEPQADFRPAREFTSSPSYKKFDLDEVEVNQLEFRSVPFNEALLDLIAGTGFNVVVGEGIDNTPLTLNFTKKKLTLKGALYVLCLAYDLEYTVEDDAIIIRKSE